MFVLFVISRRQAGIQHDVGQGRSLSTHRRGPDLGARIGHMHTHRGVRNGPVQVLELCKKRRGHKKEEWTVR
jgi:hypothetical protein